MYWYMETLFGDYINCNCKYQLQIQKKMVNIYDEKCHVEK